MPRKQKIDTIRFNRKSGNGPLIELKLTKQIPGPGYDAKEIIVMLLDWLSFTPKEHEKFIKELES